MGTLVWTTFFEDHETFNRDLLQKCYALRDQDPRGVENTNIKGWQSKNTLQIMDEFRPICDRILAACRKIAASNFYDESLEYRLEAWVNISQPGAFNSIHYHPNCHFSGVYYIQTPPGCGNIFFKDPRTPSAMVRPPIVKETLFTATEASMGAEAGRMYVFPSWLEHGVAINESGQDRVGISFNVLAARPHDAG